MVIFDVTFNVLPPDDWVVVICFKESHHILSPCFNVLEPFRTENIGQVSLDGSDGGGSEIVTENPECCDSLPAMSEF